MFVINSVQLLLSVKQIFL